MKVVIKEKGQTTKRRKYPYLGRFEDGTIVYFTTSRTGIQLNKNDIGCYFIGWNEKHTEVFEGTVELSN